MQKFDAVIANPPFSLENWGADTWTKDPYGRVICDVPPAKNGDYAWIQHMVATMTGKNGADECPEYRMRGERLDDRD